MEQTATYILIQHTAFSVLKKVQPLYREPVFDHFKHNNKMSMLQAITCLIIKF